MSVKVIILKNMTNSITFQKIKKLDKSNLHGSIEFLGKQCEQAWREIKKIKIPKDYHRVENIVVAGMGGSALGAHIIKTLYADTLRLPLEIVRNYSLPDYVGPKTLLILSSYSGTTEEVLTAAHDGLRRKAKIIGIATGGGLAKFLRKHKFPAYIFEPKYNPSSEPRMGLGYSVVGQMGILKRCGLIKVSDREIKATVEELKVINYKLRIENKNSLAEKAAQRLKDRVPILVGSEFLLGNIHTFANQINENAKCFSAYFELPELNHHLMEGLKNPASNRKNFEFILFNSNFYHPRNQKRYKILGEVLRRNKIEFFEFKLKAKTKLAQSFETLLFGSYVSFYLAMLYGLNPAPVPWVDFFKKRLK
jgi:glucose/mannose-6-phosphate isomerase